ncbi:hypothetical protein QFZ87_000916 [Bacillus sp. SLBN-46]|uniref:hypothetical protein n=1 Tax=Bacillus sp. SLBN-46 TaxID=3042283 RepID=UPI00285C0881|nr:hypothetical protein [Bacillus sp. SLBN-46]MDR6121319.1 hypothetical protein [Bacillus sp. SLBN-46]
MRKLLTILFAGLFYIFLFPITVLILMFGPIMSLNDLLDIFKYESPRLALGLAVIVLFGFILFISMRVNSLKWIYRKFPVLLPFLQMCFITFFALQLGVEFANLWADKMMYSKGIAAFLAIFTFVLGRLFLSYWYYKYPISYKIYK